MHIDLSLPKSPTGIQGLDEVTGGGLPTGRPTLICGGAGCGKTLLSIEFLVRGAMQFNEPGVFMMFEENASELSSNVQSLGFNLDQLVTEKKILLDYVNLEPSEIDETGDYDLEGLFIRLGYAIDCIGAKRVVLDTVEALFSGLSNEAILRAELRRLFRWLKDRGMTAIITGEKGEASISRYGLEEYVADCVIVLDHRVSDHISTRRLRVLKYRGSAHGLNEYPFIIGKNGFSVLPITSLQLDHQASSECASTGIKQLDEMLGGKGVYRGSSTLVSGSSGTGKSSVAAKFCETACRNGERTLLFAYEESRAQIIRNMRSIGIDLEPWIIKNLLEIHCSRPTLYGLEQHLVMIHDIVHAFRPSVVVVDPISNLLIQRDENEIKPMLMRLIDFLKHHQITSIFNSLTSPETTAESSQVGISSLMDTWLLLRNIEFNGERTRTIQVVKSRGVASSNRVREFVMNNNGIEIVQVYFDGREVLTGSVRQAQEEQQRSKDELRRLKHERKLHRLISKQKAITAQITSLQAKDEALAAEMNNTTAQQKQT
ncbi:circadian clock protein KaiC [Nitrosomonas supralitoralis]|uniref:non-specific serine/threonine protein kinase n=1 Tax=Nitrosomonas supralitoralis TaxID=2116706 RepID=A0A2P7NR40_9PROT|nr:circadian clock protein KaiC [Nitrosomonas supralitoralis]PSJ15918.1 KaiC 1 [Nitrosomonas supralitoralis]